jgi:hypothetical protein
VGGPCVEKKSPGGNDFRMMWKKKGTTSIRLWLLQGLYQHKKDSDNTNDVLKCSDVVHIQYLRSAQVLFIDFNKYY